MKRTVYDYRGFSLKKLNEPRFAHLKLLGGGSFISPSISSRRT